jgi:hypothetical protein
MIYEFRRYYVMPGKMGALNARFANFTLEAFKRHDIQVVGFWETVIGRSGVLHYMLSFSDLAHREQAWASFATDEQRAVVFRESEQDGPLVEHIESEILRPTSYSPMQ